MSVLFSLERAVPAFRDAVQIAVDAGLSVAAIIDASGKVLAAAGVAEDDELGALAAHAAHDLRTPALLDRMHAGEMINAPLGERDVWIGIVSKYVFIVIVLPLGFSTVSFVIADLRADIAHAIERANLKALPTSMMSGASSSAPADLPATELGASTRRRNPN